MISCTSWFAVLTVLPFKSSKTLKVLEKQVISHVIVITESENSGSGRRLLDSSYDFK